MHVQFDFHSVAVAYELISNPISSCSAVAVGNFQAVAIARSLEERRQEMMKKELDLEALFRMDEDGDGKVTLIEFVTGALHQISGIDPETEIHPWIQRFHELDADGNGYLDQNVRFVVSIGIVFCYKNTTTCYYLIF